ncbi:FliH/SctL family protein [Piscinibacter sp. XHJ-5]|uniref:FliH/SctL family protein n=1 Tax=Piscinibacter sp. XHJ-5 TaxID=3037797 RepID=UPI0024529645|nr:FliH/SctL family protein [Piscinibacter sp. XHJ-5]
MNTSKTKAGVRNVPAPEGAKPASPYARFIPREELGAFASWTPGTLSGDAGAAPQSGVRKKAEPEKPAEPELSAQLHAARQAGYQDGYRDGLAALEQFKQSFAAQMTAQLGQLTQSYGHELDALQQDMARALAVSATHLARQIVRSELASRPDLVATVAQEALDTLLMSARQVTVRVHPDDQPLVAQGASEVLAARGARLVADASIARGGCLVESDIGVVDASIAARWKRAVAALGCEEAWEASE